MSYILEAMRKSERDATMGQVVNLPTAAPAWYSKLLYPSLVIGLILLVVGIIWLANLWPGTPTPQGKISPTAISESRPAGTPVSAEPAAVQPAPTPKIAVTIHPEPVTEQTPTNPSLGTTPAKQRVSIATATRWQELPAAAQLIDQLPEKLLQIRIGIHVFDNTPSKRFLLINGRRYQEGDTLFGDARISEITPNGIAIKYRNLHFHTDR